MDARRIDNLARRLALEGRSRRAIARALAAAASRRAAVGLLVGIAAGLAGSGEAGADHYACRHVGAGCRRNRQCCSSRCEKRACVAHHTGTCAGNQSYCATGLTCGDHCYCWTTTGGALFCGEGGTCATCAKDAHCERKTGRGSACVVEDGGNCFGCSGRRCAPPCSSPTPEGTASSA